jgi:hypothetical protein
MHLITFKKIEFTFSEEEVIGVLLDYLATSDYAATSMITSVPARDEYVWSLVGHYGEGPFTLTGHRHSAEEEAAEDDDEPT